MRSRVGKEKGERAGRWGRAILLPALCLLVSGCADSAADIALMPDSGDALVTCEQPGGVSGAEPGALYGDTEEADQATSSGAAADMSVSGEAAARQESSHEAENVQREAAVRQEPSREVGNVQGEAEAMQESGYEAGNVQGEAAVRQETGHDPRSMQGAAAEPGSDSAPLEAGEYDFTVCFAGDINLDENWGTTQFLDAQERGIYDCICEELVDTMRGADIMCLNNEFTYSTGGAPLPGKVYTFRAKPERVEVLRQLGVDAVTLANNHVYDYGKEALLDTFTVLEEAEVPYFGAGRTLEEAMEPLYLEIDGVRIALVGASRAEKNKMTPQATETEPGILRCYDTELFLQAIREAKDKADFCIAFVHWGTEYSFDLEQVQLDTGKEYLDAGADAVIGAHSHCLQGMEYYDGKPIVYSLGNYWFNEKTLDTMLLQLHFTGNDRERKLEMQVIPAVQEGYRTVCASEEAEQRRIYDFLESISVNVEISDEGMVTEAQ